MSKILTLSCNVQLSEEGMHPDGIYIDHGENIEAYYYLPLLADLLRDAFEVEMADTSSCDIVRNLKIYIEQE